MGGGETPPLQEDLFFDREPIPGEYLDEGRPRKALQLPEPLFASKPSGTGEAQGWADYPSHREIRRQGRRLSDLKRPGQPTTNR